jgi:hypothetical protein
MLRYMQRKTLIVRPVAIAVSDEGKYQGHWEAVYADRDNPSNNRTERGLTQYMAVDKLRRTLALMGLPPDDPPPLEIIT